ncbi:hypothetical protein ACLOAV_010556 [Pseudogymnoascus australis]
MGDNVSYSIALSPVDVTAQEAPYPRVSTSGLLANSFYGDHEYGGQGFKLCYYVPLQSSPEDLTPKRPHTKAPRDCNMPPPPHAYDFGNHQTPLSQQYSGYSDAYVHGNHQAPPHPRAFQGFGSCSPRLPLLLPATAAAFAPRASSVNVVLGSKVEPWLTQTLKRINRINRIKRPLNSVPQHQRCLTETLSSANAIWTLTSIIISKSPDSELRKDSNPLIEALFNFQLIHIEAYIVYVDMVLQNEVAFKLTPQSIEALINYHKEIHCANIVACTYNWVGKELQAKKLHEEFIQAINEFVYRTNANALKGLEEEGAGELPCSMSNEVKSSIMNLFLPLLPLPLNQPPQLRVGVPSEYKKPAGPHKCERISPKTGKPCNTTCSRQYDLKRHKDTIHNGRKVHCRFCGMTFHRKDYMKNHIHDVDPEIKASDEPFPDGPFPDGPFPDEPFLDEPCSEGYTEVCGYAYSDIFAVKEAMTAQDAQSPSFLTSSRFENSFYGHPESNGQDFKVRIANHATTPEALRIVSMATGSRF